MPGDIRILEAAHADAELLDAMERLVRQLSSSAAPPTIEQLEEIVNSQCTTLLLARDGAQADLIVGSLTLATFCTPTGVRAWIEDVVVDPEMRGRGIGEALVREAIERARSRDALTLDLTSRPSRTAANRLYRRLGFRLRETNVYRYSSGAGTEG